jgi:putative phosphoesterase
LRIAVVSDIHSNLDAFETVIENLPAYDKLICLGDIVGYGPQPNEVVERLRQLRPTTVLLGNHDHAVATGDVSNFSQHAAVAVQWTRKCISQANLAYLSHLQPSARMEIGSTSLGLYHGSPRDPLAEYIFPGLPATSAKRLIHESGARLVLLGHTHVPMLYSFEEEMLGNPGSVGQPRDGDPRASFAILTLTKEKFSFDITRAEYNIDPVAQKIRHAGLPEFLAERLYAGM